MSEQQKSILKERLATARKLAKEGRYDAARYILEQIEHPQAEAMLQALENRADKVKSKPLFSIQMLVMVIGAVITISGIVMAVLFIPYILEAPQRQIDEAFYNEVNGNIILSQEEVLYANLAMYCYDYTGYGGDLCLDWTEFVLADYRSLIGDCLAPLIDAAIPDDEIFTDVGICLHGAGIPRPL